MSKPVTLAQAWEALHFTVLRTSRCTKVPLTSEVFQLMIGEVLSAWETSDNLAGEAPVGDIEALRVACLWHLTCVVKLAIANEASRGPSEHAMGELRALWHWATSLEVRWNAEASELIERLQRTPHYAAEGAGVLPAATLLAGDVRVSFVTGGDA